MNIEVKYSECGKVLEVKEIRTAPYNITGVIIEVPPCDCFAGLKKENEKLQDKLDEVKKILENETDNK